MKKLLVVTIMSMFALSALYIISSQSHVDSNNTTYQISNNQILFNRIGHYECGEIINDVILDDSYAILSTVANSFKIVDCSDPSNLTEIGSYTDESSEQIVDLVLNGDYLYYIDDSDYLKVIDITDPTNPTKIGQYNFYDYGPFCGAMKGNLLYISCHYLSGIITLNVTDPEIPVKIGEEKYHSFSDVVIKGSYGFFGGDGSSDFSIYNLNNPNSIVKVSNDISTGNYNNFYVTDDYVYGVDDLVGLEIIDISDKVNPSLVNSFDTGGFPFDIVVSNDYAMIADYLLGLQILNISDLNDPVILGQYKSDRGNSYKLVYEENKIYMADGINGLEIIKFTLDSDNDGVSDEDEITIHGTNPNNPDSDSDLLPDGWEVQYGLNPNKATDALEDADNDRLTNLEEYNYGTDPTNVDTDGDGYWDSREIDKGSDPLDANSMPVIAWALWMTIVVIAAPSTILILSIVVALAVRKNKNRTKKPKPDKQKKPKVVKKKKPKQVKPTKQQVDEDLVRRRLETMKKIVVRYNKISLDRLMNVLEFSNTKELDLWLLSLPEDLEFLVDGNELVLPQTRFLEDTNYSQAAINKLEESFKQLNYSCYHCGLPVEKDTKICPDCSQEIIRCAVCKLPVAFGETLGKCSLCEAQGHIAHMQEWVKTQGKCPQCLQNLPVEGIVPVTPDVKPQKK